MEENKKIRKPKKMRKLEKKIAKLTEKNNIQTKQSTSKKIMKLEKKKAKLEKWLKIKLPFRFLIKTGVTWLILGGVCYGCSYVPVVREIKMTTMAAIAYVAPEPVVKVLDVVTLNVGASNSDFKWLKTTLLSYLNGEIKLDEVINENTGHSGGYSFDGEKYVYHLDGKEVTEAEYKKYEEDREKRFAEMEQEGKKQQAQTNELMQDVFGTTSANDITTMSIPEILMKVATNSTPEIVSQVLDMTDLTAESKQRVEQDINRALKIIPKLNNNQMNELVEIITNAMNKMQEESNKMYQDALEAQKGYQTQMEEEQRQMELMQQQLDQMKNK